MRPITLLYSTGDTKIDGLIRGAIGILETVFPQRIGGYYLVGSYEDGTQIPTSDLDIVPIFKGSMTEAEITAYWQVMEDLELISPIHLGFGLRNEEDSFRDGGVGIKIGSKLLYGEDVRDQIPLWSLDVYLQHLIGAHFQNLVTFRGGLPPLSFPLTYPIPNGEFYGYDHFGTVNEAGLGMVFGHVMVMASTLVTLKTGEYNASKSRSYEFYRQHINDAWNGFLETLYQQCKAAWHYQIPTSAPDKQLLRNLCEQILAFENHFLEQVKPYLLMQREQGSAWAAEQLAKISLS